VEQQSITERVKKAAVEIGFDAVSVARADALTSEMVHYQSWLSNGYHGLLGYMERNLDKKLDVRELLPGARSVVVVARNYYTPFKHEPDACGKISRYAWGDDYHEIMWPMLNELAEVVAQLVPGTQSKGVVDTAPVMDKQWAVRSGLGWQGKHSNILRRDIGSWFFIGVLITTAELETDDEYPDYCGSCTACIEACPTGAIVEPYIVDATRCISYWTIEVKPEHQIPDTIVNELENWMFGCDICQNVCPWNRFQTPTTENGFLPRNGELELDPEDVLNMDQASFSARFRKSPIKRTKLAGLQRSAEALKQTNKS